MFLATTPLAKCRALSRHELPFDSCVIYRHKERLPDDAAPFFDLYADEQQPDTFLKRHLLDKLPFRTPLLETEAFNTLTLEHQICLAAAADTCSFLKPFTDDARHHSWGPPPETDPPGGRPRGGLADERGADYDGFSPRTQWQEDHVSGGFWIGALQSVGGTASGDVSRETLHGMRQDGAGTQREPPWLLAPSRYDATEASPFSLRGVDDYAEPPNFKSRHESGVDALSSTDTLCYEQCTWLRGRVFSLWHETREGRDDECTAARVWFDNGCWHDGTPLLQPEHREQQGSAAWQRQKLAAMFASCEWLGVADTPLWVLRELQARPHRPRSPPLTSHPHTSAHPPCRATPRTPALALLLVHRTSCFDPTATTSPVHPRCASPSRASLGKRRRMPTPEEVTPPRTLLATPTAAGRARTRGPSMRCHASPTPRGTRW